MRVTCFVEYGRLPQLTALGGLEQLVVGNAAPQKKGETRRELDIADRIHATRTRVRRIDFDAVQELRADEETTKRPLDSDFEATLLTPLAVQFEQRLYVGASHLATIRTPRERPQDRVAAVIFARAGPTDEDAASARTVARRSGSVRAADLDTSQRCAESRFGDVVASGERTQEWQPRRLIERSRLVQKRGDDVMRSGRDCHAHIPVLIRAVSFLACVALQPLPFRCLATTRTWTSRLHGGFSRRRALAAPGGACRTWQREQLRATPIEAHFELLHVGIDRHLLVEVARQSHLDDVLAVDRKRVTNARAAARPERQTGQLMVLCEIVGDTEEVDVCRRRGNPDRHAADLLRY